MTSQAAAAAALPAVVGIAFLGFPLHPPGRPATDRADHLGGVRVPLLFIQGTRDDFAELGLLRPVVERLGTLATLVVIDGADHSFRVPARAGRSTGEVMAELLDAFAEWTDRALAGAGATRQG